MQPIATCIYIFIYTYAHTIFFKDSKGEGKKANASKLFFF